jgi:hypothetical protein
MRVMIHVRPAASGTRLNEKLPRVPEAIFRQLKIKSRSSAVTDHAMKTLAEITARNNRSVGGMNIRIEQQFRCEKIA